MSNGGETIPGSLNTRALFKGSWKAYRYLSRFFKLKHLRYLLHVLRKGVPKEHFWNNADLPLYLAFDSFANNFPAKRIVFMEWDCYCNVSIRDFYKEVWDADLAARHVIDPSKEPDWGHFKNGLPEGVADTPETMYGIAPLAGILLSKQGLQAICEELKRKPAWRSVFCELRVATIARHLGLSIIQLPDQKSKFLRGSPPCWEFSEIDQPAVWHMVKE